MPRAHPASPQMHTPDTPAIGGGTAEHMRGVIEDALARADGRHALPSGSPFRGDAAIHTAAPTSPSHTPQDPRKILDPLDYRTIVDDTIQISSTSDARFHEPTVGIIQKLVSDKARYIHANNIAAGSPNITLTWPTSDVSLVRLKRHAGLERLELSNMSLCASLKLLYDHHSVDPIAGMPHNRYSTVCGRSATSLSAYQVTSVVSAFFATRSEFLNGDTANLHPDARTIIDEAVSMAWENLRRDIISLRSDEDDDVADTYDSHPDLWLSVFQLANATRTLFGLPFHDGETAGVVPPADVWSERCSKSYAAWHQVMRSNVIHVATADVDATFSSPVVDATSLPAALGGHAGPNWIRPFGNLYTGEVPLSKRLMMTDGNVLWNHMIRMATYVGLVPLFDARDSDVESAFMNVLTLATATMWIHARRRAHDERLLGTATQTGPGDETSSRDEFAGIPQVGIRPLTLGARDDSMAPFDVLDARRIDEMIANAVYGVLSYTAGSDVVMGRRRIDDLYRAETRDLSGSYTHAWLPAFAVAITLAGATHIRNAVYSIRHDDLASSFIRWNHASRSARHDTKTGTTVTSYHEPVLRAYQGETLADFVGQVRGGVLRHLLDTHVNVEVIPARNLMAAMDSSGRAPFTTGTSLVEFIAEFMLRYGVMIVTDELYAELSSVIYKPSIDLIQQDAGATATERLMLRDHPQILNRVSDLVMSDAVLDLLLDDTARVSDRTHESLYEHGYVRFMDMLATSLGTYGSLYALPMDSWIVGASAARSRAAVSRAYFRELLLASRGGRELYLRSQLSNIINDTRRALASFDGDGRIRDIYIEALRGVLGSDDPPPGNVARPDYLKEFEDVIRNATRQYRFLDTLVSDLSANENDRTLVHRRAAAALSIVDLNLLTGTLVNVLNVLADESRLLPDDLQQTTDYLNSPLDLVSVHDNSSVWRLTRIYKVAARFVSHGTLPDGICGTSATRAHMQPEEMSLAVCYIQLLRYFKYIRYHGTTSSVASDAEILRESITYDHTQGYTGLFFTQDDHQTMPMARVICALLSMVDGGRFFNLLHMTPLDIRLMGIILFNRDYYLPGLPRACDLADSIRRRETYLRSAVTFSMLHSSISSGGNDARTHATLALPSAADVDRVMNSDDVIYIEQFDTVRHMASIVDRSVRRVGFLPEQITKDVSVYVCLRKLVDIAAVIPRGHTMIAKLVRMLSNLMMDDVGHIFGISSSPSHLVVTGGGDDGGSGDEDSAPSHADDTVSPSAPLSIDSLVHGGTQRESFAVCLKKMLDHAARRLRFHDPDGDLETRVRILLSELSKTRLATGTFDRRPMLALFRSQSDDASGCESCDTDDALHECTAGQRRARCASEKKTRRDRYSRFLRWLLEDYDKVGLMDTAVESLEYVDETLGPAGVTTAAEDAYMIIRFWAYVLSVASDAMYYIVKLDDVYGAEDVVVEKLLVMPSDLLIKPSRRSTPVFRRSGDIVSITIDHSIGRTRGRTWWFVNVTPSVSEDASPSADDTGHEQRVMGLAMSMASGSCLELRFGTGEHSTRAWQAEISDYITERATAAARKRRRTIVNVGTRIVRRRRRRSVPGAPVCISDADVDDGSDDDGADNLSKRHRTAAALVAAELHGGTRGDRQEIIGDLLACGHGACEHRSGTTRAFARWVGDKAPGLAEFFDRLSVGDLVPCVVPISSEDRSVVKDTCSERATAAYDNVHGEQRTGTDKEDVLRPMFMLVPSNIINDAFAFVARFFGVRRRLVYLSVVYAMIYFDLMPQDGEHIIYKLMEFYVVYSSLPHEERQGDSRKECITVRWRHAFMEYVNTMIPLVRASCAGVADAVAAYIGELPPDTLPDQRMIGKTFIEPLSSDVHDLGRYLIRRSDKSVFILPHQHRRKPLSTGGGVFATAIDGASDGGAGAARGHQ